MQQDVTASKTRGLGLNVFQSCSKSFDIDEFFKKILKIGICPKKYDSLHRKTVGLLENSYRKSALNVISNGKCIQCVEKYFINPPGVTKKMS